MIVLPEAFARVTVDREGAAGSARLGSPLSALPATVREVAERWDCTADGELLYGGVGIVIPVLRKTTEPAVLKVSFPHLENRFEPDALSAWGGRGAGPAARAGRRPVRHAPGAGAPHDAGPGRGGRRGGGYRGERQPSPRRPRRTAPASRQGRRVGGATTPGRSGLPERSAVPDGAGRDGDGARTRALPAGHPHPRRPEHAEHPFVGVVDSGVREEVPGLRHGVADRREEVAPSLLRVGCGEAISYSIFFGGRGTGSPSWRPPRLRTLHGLIVVEPLQTGAAAAEPGHIHAGETAVEQVRAVWIPFSLCLRMRTSAGRSAITQFAVARRSSDHTPSTGFNTGARAGSWNAAATPCSPR